MLRQNRYKVEDFIISPEELKLNGDEILLSEKHDIVIELKPDQIKKYNDLKDFIVEISRNIANFDNLTQDYYETISDDTDFPTDLVFVHFEDNIVTLEYWCTDVNSQFNVSFCYHDSNWKLKYWCDKDILSR